MYYKF